MKKGSEGLDCGKNNANGGGEDIGVRSANTVVCAWKFNLEPKIRKSVENKGTRTSITYLCNSMGLEGFEDGRNKDNCNNGCGKDVDRQENFPVLRIGSIHRNHFFFCWSIQI